MRMTAPLSQLGDQPVFAHQVCNMLARQAKEDREAIGALLDRRGFRRQDIEAAATKHHARIGTAAMGVDFHRASPLTGRPRQSSGARIPHFDFSRVTAKHPLVGKDGKASASLRSGPSSAVGHFDYVTRGAVVTLASHLDYIRRDAAVEDLEAGLVIDMLDEAELRNEQNRLALFSNIDGGLTRQRSLFEAAERCARKPRRHELVASTQMLPAFEAIHEHVDDAPGSMADMIRRLRESHQRAEEKATKTGQPLCHVTVPIALVTPEQASDCLAFFDRWPTMVSWKQGRTGRSQTRFVGDLPANLTPTERHAIVQRFCDRLAEFGYMYVAAIHQPDPQSNRANHHVHVDAYDRPAKWLDEHDCWDFDYREKRRGKTVYPYRQNKVRHEALDANGRKIRCNDAALMRRLFIDEVNAFVGGRPGVAEFLHGTYAENGIALTPLEHMGNRAIAAEKRGVATAAGTINAHRIVRDELRICESRAATAERELDREMVLMRRMSADSVALAEYETLRRQAIERRVQAEFCNVIVAMARSRADAVASALSIRSRMSTRARDSALLKAAQAHLLWVEREAPTEAEHIAVSRTTAAMEHEAEDLRVRLLDGCDRPGIANLRYRPRNRETAPVRAPDPRFEAQMRRRLITWIDKHGADDQLLVIESGEVALASGVPPSIDTLMRHFRAR